ncbi:MAG: cation-translocating P-type ATPase [Saprospiraceae bacterium]|nr:cation-translocating P-type ATPase [Saprospiraceae bacterium]
MQEVKYKGLTDQDVIQNRAANGTNTIKASERFHFLSMIRDMVKEPLFAILLVTALVYFVLGEYSEGVIMILALLFVSGISLYQENRSRNAVASLQKLADPKVKVFRNGAEVIIPAEELVTGDIFGLEDGDIVSADGMVLSLNDLSVNESVLTGESLPVFKRIESPENTIFKGTTVVSGAGVAKVTAVGAGTKMGLIGISLFDIKEEKTPLQLQISRFTRSLVLFGVVAFIVVWGMNYLVEKNVLSSLLKGLTLAMSVLPEEIPVAFSTFMALGAYHLYKKRVITRSPVTVETLGAATVICTDKTGTLTENKMSIAAIYEMQSGKTYDYTLTDYSYTEVLEYAMWASETTPFDSMEKSIHEVYSTVAKEDLRQKFHMVHEYPLSGNPPFMTHVFSNHTGRTVIAVKGSVESILAQCKLSDQQKANIIRETTDLASRGFRVLAVGRSNHNPADLPLTQQEFEFEFMGLVAFYDPPKKNISVTLQHFYDAGIQVKMITGDHVQTAAAIAKMAGIKNYKEVVSGEEVMGMDKSQLRVMVKNINVFARMFPEAKLKVIEALKSNGEVVAMTGDGVNDAPALKAAHIGIAMGRSGSEVAKNAAALILMDDNLSHMVEAVALGRKIYENLKKAIRYIISIHIPVIFIVAVPLLFYWKFTDIFSPVHVIFLELIMGPTCSIIFENEPIEQNSMRKPPRKMTIDFFSFKELSLSVIQGLLIAAGCLGLGYYYMKTGGSPTLVRTMIYTTLIFSNIFLTLINRSFYFSVLKTIRYKNKLIPLIIVISLTVLFLSIYYEPVQHLFKFQSLHPSKVLVCMGTAFAAVMWVEGYKFFIRR